MSVILKNNSVENVSVFW